MESEEDDDVCAWRYDAPPPCPSFPALLHAAHAGDVAALRREVETMPSYASLDDRHGEEGVTALTVAARAGHVECVRTMLTMGADVHAHDEDMCTPLMIAASRGRTRCVQALLEYGADVDARDVIGHDALMRASHEGCARIARLLLASNAMVNSYEDDGWTPLMLTAEAGHVACMRALLVSDANANANDDDGWTALMLSAQNGHLECVELLIDAGAHLDTRHYQGDTALMLAADEGHTRCVAALLSARASPQVLNQHGWSALLRTVRNGHAECAWRLVNAGATTCIATDGNFTMLMAACASGMLELAMRALPFSDIDAMTNTAHSDIAFTALKYACARCHTDVIAMLLDAKASVDIPYPSNMSALAIASMYNRSSVVDTLLRHQADVNAVCNNGQTPLMLACAHGCVRCVDLLCTARGQMDARSATNGTTALMEASRYGWSGCVSSLLEAGARVDLVQSGGERYTALAFAAARGYDVCVNFLLRAGANPDQRIASGSTSLLLAAQNGHVKAVELLIGADADVHASTRGQSALMLAIRANHLQTIRMLMSRGAHTSIEHSTVHLLTMYVSTDTRKWIVRAMQWHTDLHFVDVNLPDRTRTLLRAGADVYAARYPGAPTPVDVARTSNLASARLVLRAAEPWSPSTHDLFPVTARSLACELLRLGMLLANSHVPGTEMAFCDVWVHEVMPRVVCR